MAHIEGAAMRKCTQASLSKTLLSLHGLPNARSTCPKGRLVRVGTNDWRWTTGWHHNVNGSVQIANEFQTVPRQLATHACALPTPLGTLHNE